MLTGVALIAAQDEPVGGGRLLANASHAGPSIGAFCTAIQELQGELNPL